MEIKDMNNEEIDLLLEEENIQSIDIARYAITSYRTDRTIDNLIKWKKQDKLIIPSFQRDYVWNYKNCVKLIESILLGLPIPDLFVYKEIIDGVEYYNLIDGYQRVSTIESFKNGIWKSGTQDERKFIINDKQSKWYGKTYQTLSDEDKNFFDDYVFSLTIFDSIEKDDSKKKLYMTEVFERINTGSIKLSEQEVRNAVYAGDILSKIKEIAQSNTFSALTYQDKSIQQRKKDEEIILRFATYYLIYTNYTNGLNKFIDTTDKNFTTSKSEMLNNFLYYCNVGLINYDDILNKIKESFEYLKTYDSNVFYARSRDNTKLSHRVHEIFAEAIMISLMDMNKFNQNGDFLESLKSEIWANENDKEIFTVATTSLENVKRRVEYIKHKLG